MATETKLGTVHVFNSETAFNTNKDSVGSSDIALVKIENLEMPGYVSSRDVKLLPIYITDDRITQLCGEYASGNITLSQPYTNFDGLLIVATGDGSSDWERFFLSSAEITARLALAKTNNAYAALFHNNKYWCIRYDSTTTTFINSEAENCRIKAIYGVNL